ncbi:hypothetical protein COCOBI_02-4550 [Coccomyxa sp. Obi]|nr:hypothetical protein COCOBI_02-4550 [Coccomyxa sp. Obi]
MLEYSPLAGSSGNLQGVYRTSHCSSSRLFRSVESCTEWRCSSCSHPGRSVQCQDLLLSRNISSGFE